MWLWSPRCGFTSLVSDAIRVATFSVVGFSSLDHAFVLPGLPIELYLINPDMPLLWETDPRRRGTRQFVLNALEGKRLVPSRETSRPNRRASLIAHLEVSADQIAPPHGVSRASSRL